MEKVLFDTNVLLDILLKRNPHFENASKLFALIDEKKILGHITASTITDIYYISKKEKGHKLSIEFISNLIEVVEVIGVDRDVVVKALKFDIKDFEDAIQISAAEFNDIDCIITRNVDDYSNSNLKIYSPEEFLKSLK